jgi:hypothetical protein
VNRHSHEFTYSELPSFLSSVKLDFHPDGVMEQDNEKMRFPLLEDVFKRFPQTLVNIEIKTPGVGINKAVSELIRQYKRESLTIWGARSI